MQARNTSPEYSINMTRIARKLQQKGVKTLTNRNFLDPVSQYCTKMGMSWWTPRQVFKALVKGGGFKHIARGEYTFQKDLSADKVREEVRKYSMPKH